MDDNYSLERFRTKVSASATKPLLAVNMGAAGQFSRIVNPVFTPITHEAMPFKAAPGQLSFVKFRTL